MPNEEKSTTGGDEETKDLPLPEKDLPLPEKDLPLPEKDLPLPEKEITAGESKAEPISSNIQNQTIVGEEENGYSAKKAILTSFLLGIVFIIIIIIIGAGIFLSKKSDKPQSTQVVKTQVRLASPTPAWKIYTNAKYHFSFNYPAHLTIRNDDSLTNENITFLEKPNDNATYKLDIGVHPIPKNIDLLTYLKNNKPIPYNRINDAYSKTVVNGYEAIIHTSELPCMGDCKEGEIDDKGLSVIIKGDQVFVSFGISTYSPGYPTASKEWLDQILSTFKFTVVVSPTPAASAENFCPNPNGMSYEDALVIAKNSECGKQGTLKTTKMCNSNGTGYWWLDFTPTAPKSGCNPACVVDIASKKAEINWRCTGLQN